MKNNNIKIPENAKLAFKGKIFEVYQWDQEMFDGTTQVFESIRRRDTVIVLATTTDKKIVVSFEEQPHRGKFISLPGGIMEDEGDELENAKRELEEETGYRSDEWKLWQKKDTLENWKIEWWTYVFIAKNSQKTGQQKLDPGEKIETKEYSFEEFVDLCMDESFRSKDFTNFFKELKHMSEESRKEEIEKFKKLIF